MTHDELMSAINESGLVPVMEMFAPEIIQFAHLITDIERNACADMCEELAIDAQARYKGLPPYEETTLNRGDPWMDGISEGAWECEVAIRDKGEKLWVLKRYS